MRPVLANLGFILQMAGLLIIIPIIVAFLNNETEILISFFITAIAFLSYGFLLNALAERKVLNLKSSCILVSIAFVFLGLIGSIPYFYMNAFGDTDYFQRFTNGFFESISGYTTTGFSFFADTSDLPKSLLVYRSLTELIGGVGIVFILLSFFYPSKALESFSQVIGIDKIDENLREIFLSVLAIYSFFIILFTILFYLLGFRNIFTTSTFVIDTLTGGFQPPAEKLLQYMTVPVKYFILVLMFLGSVNFIFHYRIFSFRLKDALTLEVIFYVILIVVATLLISYVANIELFDSLFHVISMSSETGYDYINILKFNDTVKVIFVLLMIIGACGFSMAGGIRIYRVILFFKSVGIGIKKILGKEVGVNIESEELSDTEIIYNLLSILLFVGVLFVSAIVFSTVGISFFDSLFEVTSAISTNGISMGITNISLALQYKWLIIALMIFGRVEIMPILVSFGSYPEPEEIKAAEEEEAEEKKRKTKKKEKMEETEEEKMEEEYEELVKTVKEEGEKEKTE